MAKQHLLKLPKKASLWTTKSVEIDGDTYTAELYTYYTRDGFAHFARITKGIYYIADAKITYLNRTWERYTGEATYRSALNYAVASGDIYENTAKKIFNSLDQSI